MNISNLNEKQLLVLGLTKVMNIDGGRIGFYHNHVISLDGMYTIDDLVNDIAIIDQHCKASGASK